MPADYPPPGTRVRWRARYGWRHLVEGVVGRWLATTPDGKARTVLAIRDDDGTLYHPRPEWLEIVEEAADG